MFKISLLVAVLICIGFTAGVSAQNSGQRAQELAAALDKTKYKKKEKRNITVEVYVNIKNQPVVKNPAEYSGLYRSDSSDYKLQLNVSSDGSATGSGYDSLNFGDGQRVNFNLRDARVEGAVLSATKVFDNGTSEKFEAVFVNRSVAVGQNPNSISTNDSSYGLGFIQTNGTWTNRVFLDFMR